MMQVATSFLQGQEAASNQERKKVPQAWKHQEGSHRKQIEDMLKAGKLSHIIRELKQSSGKEQPKKKCETFGQEKQQFYRFQSGQRASKAKDNSILTVRWGFRNQRSNIIVNKVKEERVKAIINPEHPEQTTPTDMTGVPRQIAEHKLNVRKGCQPVRQKKRGQAAERNVAINDDVSKLVTARIMREVFKLDANASSVAGVCKGKLGYEHYGSEKQEDFSPRTATPLADILEECDMPLVRKINGIAGHHCSQFLPSFNIWRWITAFRMSYNTLLSEPDIPDLEEFRNQYREQKNPNPPLQRSKEIYLDTNKEKTRNRFPIATLLQQNPDSYRALRFTCEGTMLAINTARDWYYASCSKCIKKVIDGSDMPTYNFKAAISDGTAIGQFTSVTPNADILTGTNCPQLVKLYNTPDPREFPTELLELQGQSHIFQFHYNPYCEKGRVDFYFDTILDNMEMQAVRQTQT
ncbi:nucleic acid-binding, OB-fold protein [Tanacetum coccineum]